MAFKTIKQYNEERYGGLFLLRDDEDYADVIFMYRSVDDVLQADVHYIKSNEYTGYAHCCGAGCPACAKNIRVQSKLFIPLYNIEAKEVQFFDRNIRWEQQLQRDVLSRYSNPSEYIFRITRHGVSGDTDTYYTITCIAHNDLLSYDAICAKLGIQLPDYYSSVCRELSIPEMSLYLEASGRPAKVDANIPMPEYKISPRVAPSAVINPVEPIGSTEVPEPAEAPIQATPVIPTSYDSPISSAETDAAVDELVNLTEDASQDVDYTIDDDDIVF